MLTESSAHSNNINPFQIYPPLSGNGSPQPTRASSVRRIRQGLGIKAIIETIEAKSNPIVINTPNKPLPSTHTTISTANSPTGSKSPIPTTAGFSDTIIESKKPKLLSLREKRLQDIQAYRTFCDKSASSPRSETTYNLKPNLINSTAKSTSSGTRFLSPSSSLRKRRNLKISQITTHDNFSGGFSLNGLSREQDSASRLSANTSPLFQANTPTQKFLDPSIRIHTDFRDNTTDSPGPKMIELKLLADSQVESQAVPPEGRSPSLRHGISTATLKKRGIEITSPKYSENNYFSAASTYSYGFSGINPTTVNNSPTLVDVSAQTKRVSPKEEYNISPDGWKEYSQKAQDKMPRLKPKLKQRENVAIPDNLNNSDTQRMLQSIKPIYSEFITEKFDESIVNRINTFNAFGFTRDEKNDNHEINMFFNDINHGKDITGTMCMVDLWSSQQRKDVAQKAKFAQEKLMLEKFAFYTSEIQKRLVPTKGQRGKPPKANDSLDKHKYAMLELSKSAEKNQKFALMSPMQRHMELKGKTFYEPKEATVEAQEALKNMNEWNMGLGALMDDLKQFEEQNQNDYLNLLKIRNKKKKTELEGKDKMKTIKNLKEFRSQQPK